MLFGCSGMVLATFAGTRSFGDAYVKAEHVRGLVD